MAELSRTAEGVISAKFDLDEIAQIRAGFGFFEIAGPEELYGVLGTADGKL